MLESRWSSVLRQRNTASPAKSPVSPGCSNSVTTTIKPQSENKIESKPKTKCNVTSWKRKEITTKTNAGLNCCESDGSEDLPTFKVQIKKPLTKKRKTSVKKKRNIKPSWQQLLLEIKELEEYKIKVAKARKLIAEDNVEEVPNWPTDTTDKVKSKQPKLPVLDCKHLTVKDIKEYFEKNICFLMNIMSGKHYCKRHSKFKQSHSQNSEYSLTVSFSMIAFSFEQIHEMANLMNECFDSDNEKDEYFFKVLIPELCLKIFMDTHNMSEKEAVDYLENRPFD